MLVIVAAKAVHLIARALGVSQIGDARCAVCGESGFAAGEALKKSFTDYQILADPTASLACCGCVAVLGGHPGDKPPPLRTISFRATERGVEELDNAALWQAIVAPLPAPHVVSWAVSKQRHHALRAGVSTGTRLLIGSDSATIEYIPKRDATCAAAVVELASCFARRAIVAGDYRAPEIAKFGVARWRAMEALVAPYRGSPLLDLLAAVGPDEIGPDTWRTITSPWHPEEVDDMVDPADCAAADLLARVARASEYRRSNGIRFWDGFFRHRVERFRHMPLATMLSRLFDNCEVNGSEAATIAATVSRMDAEETTAVAAAIRDRPGFIIALACERMRQEGGYR